MLLNQSKLVCFLGVLLAVSIGATIRYQIVLQDLLWLDELHTSWVTSDTFGAVTPRALQGNQSPFYFWIAWPVTQQMGQSTYSLRFVSLICGVLLMLATGYLAWRWTRSALAGLIVAWLMALDPGFVFYGTEARPYALLQLLSVIQVIFFWLLLIRLHDREQDDMHQVAYAKPQSITWIGIATVILSAAVFNCHYTGAWLFIAELLFVAAYLLIASFHRDRTFQIGRALTTLPLLACGVTLLCIPAGLHLLEVFDRRATGW